MSQAVRFLADEDFDNDIIRGMLRRESILAIVRVQDVGLAGADDPAILEWAARENRIVITHDVSTMTAHAYRRVSAGQSMPGVFAVAQSVAINTAIEDLLLIAACSVPGEWEGQVRHLPLR